jgi:phage shock protein PspC (stress-responsive transcriptional regulator)
VRSLARSHCRFPTPPGSHPGDLLICCDGWAFWSGDGAPSGQPHQGRQASNFRDTSGPLGCITMHGPRARQTSGTGAAHASHTGKGSTMSGMASDLEAPDFDPDRTPGSAPGIQGRVRVAPDIPDISCGAQWRCQADPLDTDLKEVRQAMNDIRQSFAQQGLVRPTQGRVLGGVCAGLGRRFGIAPWPARILFVLLLMVIPGGQILTTQFCGSSCRRSRRSLSSARRPCLRLPPDPRDRGAR